MTTLQLVSLVLVLITQLLLPVLLIYWLAAGADKSRIDMLVKASIVGGYFFYIFYAGHWGLLPYVLRYVYVLVATGLTVRLLWRLRTVSWAGDKRVWGWLKSVVQLAVASSLAFAGYTVASGFRTGEPGIHVAFPLREGFIEHGGSATLINYHHADSTAQQYALDIARLNDWGMRAAGFAPSDLQDYAIYGDTIFSPCAGRVVKVRDGLDNASAGVFNKIHPAGNHLALAYHHRLIVFAHLLKHSLRVAVGDSVQAGQPLARVGNSGHTSEPHLHIHAIAGTDTSQILKGNGIPIYFDGRFLTRNDRVKKAW